tara:strand:+ start:487 stop:780 length:294 start_codon:yes stop_codon:yes gene_type:complete
MKIHGEVDLYIKKPHGGYINTGHKVVDWDELQMRKEIEQWADELSYADRWVSVEYELGEFYLSFKTINSLKLRNFKKLGPFTLTELHAKLLELKGEK